MPSLKLRSRHCRLRLPCSASTFWDKRRSKATAYNVRHNWTFEMSEENIWKKARMFVGKKTVLGCCCCVYVDTTERRTKPRCAYMIGRNLRIPFRSAGLMVLSKVLVCTLGQAKKQKAETQITLSGSWKEILFPYLKTFLFCWIKKLRLESWKRKRNFPAKVSS